MSELEIGGVKFTGGKKLAVMMALGSLIGTLYGGFEIYKDYMDMKEKLANLDPEAIEARIDVAMVELNTAVDYARDIKDDLRADVIQVEANLAKAQQQMRELEGDTRDANRELRTWFESQLQEQQNWFYGRQSDVDTIVRDAKRFFDERTSQVDEKLHQLEERLNERLQRALDNPLVGQ